MSEFATLPGCPDCGTRLSVDETTHALGNTYRKLRCECGSRFESEDRIVRRLPPVGTRTRPSVPVGTRGQGPPPAGTEPPAESRGVWGVLPSESDPSGSDPDPISPGDPIPARARRKPPATYPDQFEAIWSGTGKRGHKFAALKAWEAAGEFAATLVLPVWTAYLASLEEWRSPKDLSSWLNVGGHLQQWEPRKVSPIRRVDPAVRREEEREDAALDRRAEAHFGGLWK